MPNVRRMRYATKGPAVMPQKILDRRRLDSMRITRVVEHGRKLHKEVVIHTHFNHPRRSRPSPRRRWTSCSSAASPCATRPCCSAGVNDTVATMRLLVKRLGYVNVHPYYIYMHDLVKGVEDLRTTLQTGLDIEKGVRGATAGFNTPLVVVDAPGGGGKRDAHSFEHYDRDDRDLGLHQPQRPPGRLYYYFDPIDQLPPRDRRAGRIRRSTSR